MTLIGLLTVVASALVRPPLSDRRSALQTAGGLAIATSFPWPAAAEVDSQKFEAIKAAASASLSSTSKLVDTVADLKLRPPPVGDSFLFTDKSICKADGNQFVSVRLWKPSVSGTNRISTAEIVQGFQKRFAKNDKPKGYKAYYGAVVSVDTEQYALFANVFETKEQAEKINADERAIEKKGLLRASLNYVLPIFSSDTLSAALGGCA